MESELIIESYKIHASVVKDLGIFGLQALITINAGAVIALLTFIPKVASLREFSFSFQRMKCSLLFFIAGLFFAFFATASTYFMAQLQILNAGNVGFLSLLLWMMLPALFSFASFSIGAFQAIRSVDEK